MNVAISRVGAITIRHQPDCHERVLDKSNIADFRAGIEMEVVNSCALQRGGCDHHCTHTPEGPLCSCNLGYQLQADRKTCRGTVHWRIQMEDRTPEKGS